MASSVFNAVTQFLTTSTNMSDAPSVADDVPPSVSQAGLVFPPGGAFPGAISREAQAIIDYYNEASGRKFNDAQWEEDPGKSIDAKDEGTPDAWVPRHPSLIRLTGRHPFNCEPPLETLFNKGFITPASLHYVRNHGPTPNGVWDSHTISIGGLAPNTFEIKMKDLVQMPTISQPATLVCCGNRRKEQNMIKQTIGFNWGAAGVSTGVWTGVPLHTVLRQAGISPDNPDFPYEPNKFHIRFASESDKGGDKLPAGIYGTSVPLEKAWDPSQDIIIAFLYNGRLLTPDHGYPVRIIIPGFIGGRMIKWLTNIDLLDTISQDYYHFFDNRVLPPHVDAELAKVEGWWFKPEYICNDLSINSAIACPAHDEQLAVVGDGKDGKQQMYAVQGYAYTGGGRRITRVEISLNSGALWQLATLKFTERPTRFGKYWCWIFWSIELSVEDLANASEIVLRAWDEGHNTQPDKPTWNLMGMLNNPWFRIKIHSSGEGASRMLKFEHPTLAGTQPGGWMSRLKEHPALTAPGVFNDHVNKGDASTAVIAAAAANEAPVVSVFDPSKPSFTLAQVREHASDESAWIVVKGQVYDSTPFLKSHPGGSDSILIEAGTDCTESFEAVHSQKAWKMLDKYWIGQLRPDDANDAVVVVTDAVANAVVEPKADANGRSIALYDRKKHIPFTLTLKQQLSPDSFLLRFALQSPEHVLGLPVGQHMLFSAKIDGKTCMRAYTPTSSDHDLGHFDLVIKAYYPSPAYPQGGKMSQHLAKMQVGDCIDVKGPLGHVTYLSPGTLKVDKNTVSVKHFSCLCGGTGITPIYQVLAAILRDPQDRTQCHMLYANRTEQDILLKAEIDALIAAHPSRLRMRYILSQPKDAAAWKAAGAVNDVGRVNANLVESFLPKGGEGTACMALLCGPEGFLKEACAPALAAHGYAEADCVYF